MKEELEIFRFRGLRKDGKLICSNDINDYRLQDFCWFEECITMTKEMYENMKLRAEPTVLSSPSPIKTNK